MTKDKESGPSPQEVASTIVGGGQHHVRGGSVSDAMRRLPLSVTQVREDGMPLAGDRAPEPHGGHYFTAEDREKYDAVIGYDKGMAPGFDPIPALLGTADERGKYELKEWTPSSPTAPSQLTQTRLQIVKMNFDGSRSIVCVLAKDPAANIVQLPPNTLALKTGWSWATRAEIDASVAAGTDRRAKEAKAHKEAEKHPPAPGTISAAVTANETPEAREAREARDPVLQAQREGASMSNAEKAAEAASSASKGSKK